MNWSLCQSLVFGMGTSGMSAMKLLIHLGAKVWVTDKGEPSNWINYSQIKRALADDRMIAQEKAEGILQNINLLILSPGIPREHPLVEVALKSNVIVINEIELAYRVLPLPLLGITGTNGKTTTTTLLGEVFKDAKRNIFVGGNIGLPLCEGVLQVLKGECQYEGAILELSSFQLESIDTAKFDAGVILNIFPNHGERYNDIKDYAKAKWHLADLIKPGGILYCDSCSMPFKSSNQKALKLLDDPHAIKEMLAKEIGKSFNVNDILIPGDHNLRNIEAAWMLAKFWRISPQDFYKTLKSFKGVHHRVEYVGKKNNMLFYNDAKSTNWKATEIALMAMEDVKRKYSFKESILILGGKHRGHGDLPDNDFVDLLKSKVSQLFLVGDTATDLLKVFESIVPTQAFKSYKNIFEHLKERPIKGPVLLSPAFPSFDQFKNYADRGDTFKNLVLEFIS